GSGSCAPAVIRVADGSKGVDLVVGSGQSTADSQAMLTFPAATTLAVSLRSGATCSGAVPSGANVVIQYRAAQGGDADACPSGAFCSGVCTTTAVDPDHCGGCAKACSLEHAANAAVSGA